MVKEALPRSEKTYDGLYRIIRAWREEGKDGFLICRHVLHIPFDDPRQPSAPFQQSQCTNCRASPDMC